jgi:hypothetical protein
VTLVEGVYHGRPDPLAYELRLDEQWVVFGDLNQDGVADALAVLYERYGSSGSNTILAALVNSSGIPLFADAISLIYQGRIIDLAIDGGTIAVTVSSTAMKHAEEIERRKYKLKGNVFWGVRDESLLISTHGGTTVFSALVPILTFEIPDNFVVKPQYRDDLSRGRLDFSRVDYPKVGYVKFLTLANYTFSTAGDPDKIIRQRIGGAIEICIEGINYAWNEYPYRDKYRSFVSKDGAVLYENQLDATFWRGISVAVPIRPSRGNANTHVIFIVVRTGDKSSSSEVLKIFSNIKKSIRK